MNLTFYFLFPDITHSTKILTYRTNNGV